MTSQMNYANEFRLVTCPSCRNVLPEWPDIPVYRCGGCDAVLQAKNWKDDINATELSSRETDSSWKNENDYVSDSPNQKTIVPRIESSLDTDINGDQTEIGNRDLEEHGDSNASDELPRPTKLSSYWNDDVRLEVKESIAEGENKCPLGQDLGEYGNMSLDRDHDHTGDGNSHLYERKFKATCSLSSNKSSRNDRYGVEKTCDGGLEMHLQPTHSTSIFIGEETHGIPSGDWRLDELPEPRRHDHAIRSWTKLDKLDRVSVMPYNSRASQLVHGNGSPSNYQHHVYQQRSGFSPPNTTSHGELDKLQVLRTVYELKDKLKRAHISKQTANRRFSSEHLKEKQHLRNYTRGTGWPRHSKISRMSFLGEAAKSRRQVHCSCPHCCHHDWKCSSQLPSQSIRCIDRQYMNHPIHISCSGFPSRSWSPQHYISSEFSSWGHETKANNRKHSEHKPHRLYKGEKQCVAKRHLMPIAAGSPIISCHHCSELLQLPMDFLVFKRRWHQLRCNSCSRTLEFSLQKRSHLVPYVHDAPASSTTAQ